MASRIRLVGEFAWVGRVRAVGTEETMENRAGTPVRMAVTGARTAATGVRTAATGVRMAVTGVRMAAIWGMRDRGAGTPVAD